MYHIFLIHSSVDEHLGYFHVVAIVNYTAKNIGVHASFWTMFFQDIFSEVGLHGHMIVLFLVFKETSILFSIVAIPIYGPTNSEGGFYLSTPSPTFIVCGFFDDRHFGWNVVIFHCRFDLHFSND